MRYVIHLIYSDHIKERQEARERRLAKAKEDNELMECGCCFDDEVLQEDMLPCPDGHMFCRECVRRSSEANIGIIFFLKKNFLVNLVTKLSHKTKLEH